MEMLDSPQSSPVSIAVERMCVDPDTDTTLPTDAAQQASPCKEGLPSFATLHQPASPQLMITDVGHDISHEGMLSDCNGVSPHIPAACAAIADQHADTSCQMIFQDDMQVWFNARLGI